MSNAVNQIIERARAFVERPGWSRSRLSIESGLNKMAMRCLFEPAFNPTADTLNKIEATMDRVEKESGGNPVSVSDAA